MDMGHYISTLLVKNIKLAVLIFKMVEHCPKSYNIYCVKRSELFKLHNQ